MPLEIHRKIADVPERLAAEILGALARALQPRGAAVIIKAALECMASRGGKAAKREVLNAVAK